MAEDHPRRGAWRSRVCFRAAWRPRKSSAANGCSGRTSETPANAAVAVPQSDARAFAAVHGRQPADGRPHHRGLTGEPSTLFLAHLMGQGGLERGPGAAHDNGPGKGFQQAPGVSHGPRLLKSIPIGGAKRNSTPIGAWSARRTRPRGNTSASPCSATAWSTSRRKRRLPSGPERRGKSNRDRVRRIRGRAPGAATRAGCPRTARTWARALPRRRERPSGRSSRRAPRRTRASRIGGKSGA